MASVWYLGGGSRRITSAQWSAASAPGSEAIWNKANGYSLPRAGFTAPQLVILAADPMFNSNAPDGPRPGSAVSPADSPALKRSDLDALGIAPFQLDRRFKSFGAVKAAQTKSSPKLGPIATDVTLVSINVGVGSMGAYTKAYDATALQAVADEGEGNIYTSGLNRYAFGPFNSMAHSIRTMCNGDKFAFYCANDTATNGFHLYVDGRPTALTPYTPTPNTPSWCTITFPTVATREIEIRTMAGIGGLYTSLPYELWKPAPRRGPRVLVIGDSYTSSAGATNAMNSIYANIGPHIGSDDVWVDQYGGTGYGVTSHADGVSNPQNRYLDRLNPIVLLGQTWNIANLNPDMVVVHGGGANDKFKGRSNAQVIADAIAMFTSLRAKFPYAKLVFVEGFGPPGFTPATYNPNYISIRQGVQAGLTAIGVTYIDVASTLPWIQGAGYNGTGDATKNSYSFIGVDTYHPNDNGHLYIRNRLAPKLRRILMEEAAALEGVLI